MRHFVIACSVLFATPLLAQSTVDRVFGPDAPCFSRTYDAAHLDAHPAQQVTMIVIRADTEDMAHDATDDRLLLVDVITRDHTFPYSGIGYCAATSTGLECLLEGDAGRFTLTQQDGRLRLDVGRDGLIFEGETDFLTLQGDQGDDRVFLLDAGICG